MAFKTLAGVVTAAVMYFSSPSYTQTFTPKQNGSMYQEYDLEKATIFRKNIEGVKKTYFKFTALEDTLIEGQNVTGMIEGSTDLLPPFDEEYHILLRTYINERGLPVKSITMRKNQDKPASNKPGDLELITEEKLKIPGEKITEIGCELYSTPESDGHKKMRDFGSGKTLTVPDSTYDFLTVIYDVITNPHTFKRKSENIYEKTYRIRNGQDIDSGKGLTSLITVKIEKEGSHLKASVEEIPEDMNIPLAGGSYKYHEDMPPFWIQIESGWGVKPTANAKKDSIETHTNKFK